MKLTNYFILKKRNDYYFYKETVNAEDIVKKLNSSNGL
jgi:hypothetical protein